MAEDPSTAEQLDEVVGLLRATLGDDLVGAYLYGSAVEGGLRPASDLDLCAVIGRRTTGEQRRRLIEGLRPLSARDARPQGWRPIELTIVARPDVVPWRHPPVMDFQSGEWLRGRFDAGDIDDQPSANPDLAVLIAQVRLTGRQLVGAPASAVLDPVPEVDLRRAMADSIPSLMADLDTDTANVLLTLARIWYTLETGGFAAKDVAAEWALERMASEGRAALVRAQALYNSRRPDTWDEEVEGAPVAAMQLIGHIESLVGRDYNPPR